MRGSCHCGEVSIHVPARPAFLNQCNCTLCTKLGAVWGYYAAEEVEIVGSSRVYQRADATPPTINVHFCATCGATTHWSSARLPPSGRSGVNMRLFEPAELDGIEVRYGDRRNAARDDPPRQYRALAVVDGAGGAT